jgi:hypothetical protein
MIEMSWMELADPRFQEAMNTIWHCPALDAQTSYTAHRIQKGMEKVNLDIKNLRIQLCEKYAKKGEDGKNVVDNHGRIQFENEDKQLEFETEFREQFSTRKLVLKVKKLDFRTLAQVRGITPMMWGPLERVMDNLPQDEEEVEAALAQHEQEPPKA